MKSLFLAIIGFFGAASIGNAEDSLPDSITVKITVGKDGRPTNPQIVESTIASPEKTRVADIVLDALRNQIHFKSAEAGKKKDMIFLKVVGELQHQFWMDLAKSTGGDTIYLKSGKARYILSEFPDCKNPFRTGYTDNKDESVMNGPNGDLEVIGELIDGKELRSVSTNVSKSSNENAAAPAYQPPMMLPVRDHTPLKKPAKGSGGADAPKKKQTQK